MTSGRNLKAKSLASFDVRRPPVVYQASEQYLMEECTVGRAGSTARIVLFVSLGFNPTMIVVVVWGLSAGGLP